MRTNHDLERCLLPGYSATVVHWPSPVKCGTESLAVCVDVLYALVKSVILASFNYEDRDRRILRETSCDGNAGEATADDYIVKRLGSGIPGIPRYAICTLYEWFGGIRLGSSQDERGRAEQDGRECDEAGAHRVPMVGQQGTRSRSEGAKERMQRVGEY